MKYGYVNRCLADMWGEPRFNSERVNQLFFSEIVEWAPSSSRFVKVADLTGYEGWVDQNFLSPAPKKNCLQYDRSRNTVAYSFNAPTYDSISAGSAAGPLRLAFGTRFVASYDKKTGWYRITLPDNFTCMVGGTAVKPLDWLIAKRSAKQIIVQGRRMLGVPYLWGGVSAFGFDCSGLVKTIYGIFGVSLPRDTKDQIKCGRQIGRSQMRYGDLAFFERHVGIVYGNGLLLHCSAGGGSVRIDSIDKRNNSHEYRQDLDKSFNTARRIL
jgi:gamma-D-glutamyl-L-lysine dipeptidyl-peptidase